MLLETISILLIFCLKSFVCLRSDFELVPSVCYFISICVILIFIDTFVCICICMSLILSVLLLGSVVDFIQTWNELHNMLMTLPSFGSPVLVLDVRLYATFNCGNKCQCM